jgi:predicted glutamine amidotransferase
MSKLFGCLINDPHLVAHVLLPFQEILYVSETESPFGWGIAHHVHHEVLKKDVYTKRRPRHVGDLDFYKTLRDVQAHAIIGQVRKLSVGSAIPENTQPFTYRSWSCGHTGYVERFDQIRPWILNSIPNFLRRNIKGVTDSEAIFHLFLAFLYDDGVLDAYDLPAEKAAKALAATYKTVARFVTDAGGGETGFNVLVTNGRIMLLAADTYPAYAIQINGLSDCDYCRMPPETWNTSPRRQDHENLKFTLLLLDPPDNANLIGFRHEEPQTIVATDQTYQIFTLPLVC